MADRRTARVTAFLEEEYRAARAAERDGQVEQAWHHLERAHILAQTMLWPHCQSHWRTLLFAVGLRDWREAGGQAFRLVLAPLGNLTRRLPVGNTGRANVSAFVPMQIPADLQEILGVVSD